MSWSIPPLIETLLDAPVVVTFTMSPPPSPLIVVFTEAAVVAREAAGIAIGKPYREFKEVALDGAALDAVAGTYEVEKGVQRVFRRSADGLVMHRSGRPPVPLKAASNDTFFMPGGLDWFEFQRDASGKDTYRISLEMYRDGRSIADIAEERGLQTGTVENHLSRFIATGEVELHELVPLEKVEAIRSAVLKFNDGGALSRIKEYLGDDSTYSEIRAVIASM